MRRGEKGMALIEAIVALAILATAGVTLGSVVVSAAASERHARERETRIAAADRVLTAMTLLTRTDLDRRLGTRRVGELTVVVQRPQLTLYRIGVASADAPGRELLATLVFRPEPADGTR